MRDAPVVGGVQHMVYVDQRVSAGEESIVTKFWHRRGTTRLQAAVTARGGQRAARWALPGVACLALLGSVPAASAASPPSGTSASFVRADLITHVFPEIGHRVVAVALKYDRRLRLRPGSAAATSAFEVTATLAGVSGARTVTDVYSTSRPVLRTGRTWTEQGRYLIVELAPEDENASVNYTTADGANAPHQLIGAYAITQTVDVRDDRGHLLAARPFSITNDGVINPVVDDFARMSYTDAAGTTLDFRFFEPRKARSGRRYPLVLFLHGGGETASPLAAPDNVVQITANRGAIVWATPERQRRHPSFVVAPQLPERTSQWTAPEIRAAVIGIVDQIVANYPVDPNRIYLTGLSRGARGGIDFLSRYPAKFAGALLAASRAEGDDVSTVPQLAQVPLWLAHAVDDPVVPYSGSVAIVAALEAAGVRVTRGEWPGNNSQGSAQDRAAEAAARALLARAQATHSHTLFTTYSAGTVAVNAHFSWGPMYETDIMLDWLFDHDLRHRAAPARPRKASLERSRARAG